MAILIDPPMWPAHGTLWSHLVSDADYAELHDFAAQLKLPRRGFDLDHYDVPASLHAGAVELGAIPVGAHDLVYRLRGSGLRVRQVDRLAVAPIRRRQYLVAEWSGLAALAGLGTSGSSRSSSQREDWSRLGAEIMARWNEDHRVYHDERHLEDVLLSLDQLQKRGESLSPATLLAAWFHDAVYAGSAGVDERDSARLAVKSLTALGVDPILTEHVGDLIIATTPALEHSHAPAPLAHLLDADLSIFASSDARYLRYTTAVRAEYAHVPEEAFREGRASILSSYLNRPKIYQTAVSQQLWEDRARTNLAREIAQLRQGVSVP